ncbi:MAG: hypothetical protein WDN45_01040 [Caulobacteraceae bacterium]
MTTANASVMATGHYLGDSGDFGNYLYTGPRNAPETTNGVTPSLEDDADLNFVNAQFGGNYLNEDSLLAQARAQGFATASIGKKGPSSVHDMTARDAPPSSSTIQRLAGARHLALRARDRCRHQGRRPAGDPAGPGA